MPLHHAVEVENLSLPIRRLGFGNATLKSVANFLQQNEPYLPPRFSDLKTREDLLKYYYHKGDISSVLSMQKDRYQYLKAKKTKGFEVFKQCLAHHNAQSKRTKINIGFEESHKINLISSTPALGLLSLEKDAIKKKYKHPSPKLLTMIKDPNTLGFCYEYGLGVESDAEKAFQLYKTASSQPINDLANFNINYAAYFNLGRIYLQKKEFPNAVQSLSQAEQFLKGNLERKVEGLTATKAKFLANDPQKGNEIYQELVRKNAPRVSDWKKALSKTYAALSETYRQAGNSVEQEKYEKMAAEVKLKYSIN